MMSDNECDNEFVLCPYCKTKYSRGSEMEFDGEGDERECECEKCGKKFFAGINIVIDYYGMKSCKLNGEKHDFVMLKTNPEWGTCKKCGGINKLIDSEVL